MEQVIFPKRGEVYLANFDPTIGSKIKETRPAVILQNNIYNQYNTTTIVAPISSKSTKLRTSQALIKPPDGGLDRESVILLNQIRTIDKQRPGKRLGKIKLETMRKVETALKISIGLTKL